MTQRMNFPALWTLDPGVLYLNHGSFGACPTAVLEAQAMLRREMEREPVDFLDGSLPARLDGARQVLAQFVGAEATDLVFVHNATTAVNAVLRSLRFGPEDEVLLTSHTYAACRKTIEFVAAGTGVRPVIVALPFPLRSEEEIVEAVLARVSDRTRLALLDHVTSPTALILPIARLVSELRARGIETLVDGAHAPGMVPLALSDLGAAYYTGNAHKWLCAPKGAAFLHVRRDRQQDLHPTVISHGYPSGFRAEFDWIGTVDPTPWLTVPEAVRYMGGLLRGGWDELMARNRALALEARAVLLESIDLEAPCPESLIGSMASLILPAPTANAPAAHLDCKALHDWFRERGVETWLHEQPRRVLRISAQLYNDLSQYRELGRLLKQALHGR